MALPQNFVELATTKKNYCVLARFMTHVEVLINQGRKFLGAF